MSDATQTTPDHDPEIDRLSRNLRAALKERGQRAAKGLPLDGRVDNCLKAIRKAHPDVADAIEAAVKSQELERMAAQAVLNHSIVVHMNTDMTARPAFRRSVTQATALAALKLAEHR